jgi:glycosyltransferase involved in cell wall biosynthesis
MRTVAREFPDVLLLIGGSGYLREHLQTSILEQGLERNVRLLGFIPEDLLPAYYQAADLFVLPTLQYEGFGLATIESLACGTPVLGTPVGATPEVLEPVGDELLFRDASAEAIALGINSWLGSRRYTELRQLCREYCVSHFDKPVISSRIAQILGEVAGTDASVVQQDGGRSMQ